MALYLGTGQKVNLHLGSDDVMCLHIITSSTPSVVNNILKTLDNYILKDLNGIYLTAKEAK